MKKYLFFLLSTIIAQESFSQVNLSSGLTGYFRLDGNANDDSPTAINGTNYGAVATNGFDGTSNSAMSFASNAYMEGSYDNRGITNQMSVSFWFKTTSTATYSFLLSKYNWTLDHGFYIFIDNNGAMAMHGRDGSGNGVAPAAVGNYNDGQWHHVVGIVDVNNWDLYVDCQQIQSETTLTSSPDIIVNMPLTFGRDAYNANAYYSGDLDEVRIYDRILNPDEICALCGNPSITMGLTGYFRLDGNANDDSPTAINGTNYGAVATNGFDGTSNSAMSFASNAYMEGSYDNRGITNQMSVSFWFKTTSTSAYSFLVSKYNWTLDHGFYIFIDNNGAMAMHGRDGSGNGVAPAAVGNYNDGQWHHVVGIVDVNNWDLYVDCQQIQSETTLTSSPDISVNMPLTFGRDAYNANAYYSGDLDEVRIYNRPLTQTEICSMCNELLLMTNDDIEEKPLNFLIFPNPAPDKITLSGVPFTSYEVYLFDISGRIVDVIQNQNQIMFDDLASGTYLVAVRDYESGRIVTNRFVKR